MARISDWTNGYRWNDQWTSLNDLCKHPMQFKANRPCLHKNLHTPQVQTHRHTSRTGNESSLLQTCAMVMRVQTTNGQMDAIKCIISLLHCSLVDRANLRTFFWDPLQTSLLLRSAVGMTHVFGKGLWWVRLTIKTYWFWLRPPRFLPSGQYGLCFGYCFTGQLSLRSHNGEVTFHEACFRESLVIRLHSEIGQIHLSIEAQCDHHTHILVLGWEWLYCKIKLVSEKDFTLKCENSDGICSYGNSHWLASVVCDWDCIGAYC